MHCAVDAAIRRRNRNRNYPYSNNQWHKSVIPTETALQLPHHLSAPTHDYLFQPHFPHRSTTGQYTGLTQAVSEGRMEGGGLQQPHLLWLASPLLRFEPNLFTWVITKHWQCIVDESGDLKPKCAKTSCIQGFAPYRSGGTHSNPPSRLADGERARCFSPRIPPNDLGPCLS